MRSARLSGFTLSGRATRSISDFHSIRAQSSSRRSPAVGASSMKSSRVSQLTSNRSPCACKPVSVAGEPSLWPLLSPAPGDGFRMPETEGPKPPLSSPSSLQRLEAGLRGPAKSLPCPRDPSLLAATPERAPPQVGDVVREARRRGQAKRGCCQGF
jgi:hypothetical protein